MKTRITDLLGIEYPIFQGGMAWVAEQHLAAAVSAAGGLGLLGGASAPGEVVRDMIRDVRSMTDRPFGVNVMLMSPYADDVAEIVIREGVKIVTTGAGIPDKYMKDWKAAIRNWESMRKQSSPQPSSDNEQQNNNGFRIPSEMERAKSAFKF